VASQAQAAKQLDLEEHRTGHVSLPVVRTPVPIVHAENPLASEKSSPAGYAGAQARRVRLGFVRKVYGILTLQLTLTFLVVCLFSFVEPIKAGVQSAPGVLWAAIAVMLFFLIALACFPSVAHTVPGNYAALLSFTAAESYLIGAVASIYASETVAFAMAGTVIVVAALTAFAWQSRFDFTNCGGTMIVLLVALLVFGVWAGAYPSKLANTGLAALGIMVFGLFILFDTSMILGGSRDGSYSMALEADDYILGALMLYVDIVNLFLYMLRLLGSRES
jgi:FtsH-binding integral membrane protein